VKRNVPDLTMVHVDHQTIVGTCEQKEGKKSAATVNFWRKCMHAGMRGREQRSEIQKARDIEIMQRGHTKQPDASLRAIIK
jgi:hypothetical protein